MSQKSISSPKYYILWSFYRFTIVTTIQISEELKMDLAKRNDKDTYEEIIWDLLEDTMELSKETKIALERARKEAENGRVLTLEEVKKELGL